MIDAVISKYLESNKRLVIPKLGAFLVKQTDHVIVFSEFMKQDDGVLHGLLCREEGLNDTEAAAMIDRFVFSVRHNIKHGLTFQVGGIGTLSLGPNNTTAFRYDPSVQPMPKDEPAVVTETPRAKVSDLYRKEQPSAELHAADLATNAHRIAPTAEQAPKEDKPLSESESLENQQEKDNIRRIYEQQGLSEEETTSEQPLKGMPVVSKSPKMRPEKYVRGLQYRRPHKTTDAYEYNQPSSGKHVDKFLLLAIIAAVLAVSAILFGFYVSSQIDEGYDPHTEEITMGSTHPDNQDTWEGDDIPAEEDPEGAGN